MPNSVSGPSVRLANSPRPRDRLRSPRSMVQHPHRFATERKDHVQRSPSARWMPKAFPETGEALQDLSADVHKWLAYTMLAVAAGHVAAAFKHRWYGGHDVIGRMTFGGR